MCHLNKGGRAQRAPLLHYQAGVPGERVHLHFLGPFTTSDSGNKYILMVVDQISRWLELYALPEQTAVITAKTFFEQWIARLGAPLQIHTDQGRNFDSLLFTDLRRLMEITNTRNTPYRPSSNGQVERYNQMVLSFMRCYLNDKVTTGDEHVSALGMIIRATVNRSTGFTPNMLFLGRVVCMPEEILCGLSTVNAQRQISSRYLSELIERLRLTFLAACNNFRCHQKRDYDARKFDVGDLVYFRNSSTVVEQSKKLLPVWKGPLIVIHVISTLLYRLANREYVKHHDKFRIGEGRYIPRIVRRKRQMVLTDGTQNTPAETVADDDNLLAGVEQLFQATQSTFEQGTSPTESHAMWSYG